MTTYSQLPGELNVVVAHTDGLVITGSLGFSTAGDTLTAVIYEATAAGYAAAIAATPAPPAPLTHNLQGTKGKNLSVVLTNTRIGISLKAAKTLGEVSLCRNGIVGWRW